MWVHCIYIGDISNKWNIFGTSVVFDSPLSAFPIILVVLVGSTVELCNSSDAIECMLYVKC